jgi:hypothetical protein
MWRSRFEAANRGMMVLRAMLVTIKLSREGVVTELLRHWPRELDHVLAALRPDPSGRGAYVAEVDLSEEELKLLNLFESSARHKHVAFLDRATSQAFLATLNTPVGLGAPRDPTGHVARVRITLLDVHPH